MSRANRVHRPTREEDIWDSIREHLRECLKLVDAFYGLGLDQRGADNLIIGIEAFASDTVGEIDIMYPEPETRNE